MRDLIRIWLERLEQGRFAPLVQFVKFGLVGVSNTLISYVTEMLGYYVLFVGMADDQVRVLLVTGLSFIISVTNAYYWNNRYVFKGSRQTWKQHLRTYIRTAACYALTGLLLAPAMKLWLVGYGIPFWIASLATLLMTIPLNFLMNKFWAFKK